VPKKVAEISRKDKKVSVVGEVVDATEDSFILDDGTGKIEVFFDEEASAGSEKVAKGKTIRAFCSIDGEQLKPDVVQDMTGADLNLLKTVDDLYSKAGV
jgi:uncharacterized protein YdeI (BOF family)